MSKLENCKKNKQGKFRTIENKCDRLEPNLD